jgi:ribokinase
MADAKPVITVLGSFVGTIWMRAPRLPVRGETLIGTDLGVGPGGKGSNQAIGAARLGAEVVLIAAIGEDLFGRLAREVWGQEGIDTRHVVTRADVATGGSMVIIEPTGDNYLLVDPAANEYLTPEDVRRIEPEIARSAVVMAQLETHPRAVAEGFRIARRHGALTLLNPGPYRPLSADLLALVDVLTPNETEARQLAGLSPDDTTPIVEVAARLRALGPRIVCVTLGGDGALVATPDETFRAPAFRVPVVDATGAGDSFNAALAVALARGDDLRAAVRQANAAGALAVTRTGVVPALPTREQLAEILRLQ